MLSGILLLCCSIILIFKWGVKTLMTRKSFTACALLGCRSCCLELQDCPHTWTKEPVVFYHLRAPNITCVSPDGKHRKNFQTKLLSDIPPTSKGECGAGEARQALEGAGNQGRGSLLSFPPRLSLSRGHPLPPLADTRVSQSPGVTLCQVSQHLLMSPQLPGAGTA